MAGLRERGADTARRDSAGQRGAKLQREEAAIDFRCF
jgi:hypothetical protein